MIIFQMLSGYNYLLLGYDYLCDDPPICQKKRVFCGEKGQDPEHNTDLETRIKMPRGTPKTTIQCKNPPTRIPKFEWRTAAAGLKPLAAANSCRLKNSTPQTPKRAVRAR